MFALLPGLLLVVGIAGLVITDPARRSSLIDALATQVPPLETFFRTAADEMSKGAAPFSLVGVVGLVWGASRFYGSLDDAFARVTQEKAPRGFVSRTARGITSVVGLVGAFLLALGASAAASFLENSLGAQGFVRDTTRIGSPLVAAVVVSVGVAFVFRIVPTPTPGWRAIRVPAIVVGIALALVTDLFVYIAPRVVGAATVYGGFVAVFAAFAWLGLAFQALLLGAAWVHERGAATRR
jgi:uncharacterized BrkB/YihY/UPF0761 family membrane protein